MPTYHSALSKRITIRVGKTYVRLAPGDNVVNIYIPSPPPGVTLKSHLPPSQPFVLLFNGTPPSGSMDVSKYVSVLVMNRSGDDARLIANEDSDNYLIIPDDYAFTFDNATNTIGALRLVSGGQGNVKVWGVQ